MKFALTNPDAVTGLPPGKYQTRIVSAHWDEIKVEYVGRPYNPDDPCLLPFTVHDEARPAPTCPDCKCPCAWHRGDECGIDCPCTRTWSR